MGHRYSPSLYHLAAIEELRTKILYDPVMLVRERKRKAQLYSKCVDCEHTGWVDDNPINCSCLCHVIARDE